MQVKERYHDHLPLEGESGYSRRIYIDSAKIDDEHIQIRGELLDQRADYQDVEESIPVHGMVVRLTFNINTRNVTRSEMALPQMAFKGLCKEQMPSKAEELIGISVDVGFNQKIAETFGSTRGCMHLMALYRAIGLSMTQVNSWNYYFPMMDETADPENLKGMMDIAHSMVVDSCHVWQADIGGATKDFAKEEYGPMLERCTPQLLGRWKQYKEGSE